MILDQDNNLPATLSEQAEQAIYEMAEAMGILVTEEEAEILAKFDEAAIIKKVEKLELDSQTPKRGARASSWIRV